MPPDGFASHYVPIESRVVDGLDASGKVNELIVVMKRRVITAVRAPKQ